MELLKPLSGLYDASRKFWVKVRVFLLNMVLKTIEGDEAFYLKNEGGQLKGGILIQVDDFTLAGEETFLEKALKGRNNCMKESKVEENNFRYTGLDVKRCLDGITGFMDYYVDSLAEIKDIRKASGTENLTKLKLKQYRMMVGKFHWLA